MQFGFSDRVLICPSATPHSCQIDQLAQNGGQIGIMYTDLEKAFDKVLYLRLLSKLNFYKVHKKAM